MEDSTRAEQTALSYRHRHCTICHPRRHRHPGTHCPCGAPEGGRGSARPGALSFHSRSAPFLKGPRSATPGEPRVELCWAGSNSGPAQTEVSY